MELLPAFAKVNVVVTVSQQVWVADVNECQVL